ncbi:hypothetical protein TNCV_3634241 [Trichonephila clavipes]|nr:hypothetical protein TNCV_3634241 [Trichonephila clavipes]
MVLPGKVRGELIKLYYQNGMNAAEALRVSPQSSTTTRPRNRKRHSARVGYSELNGPQALRSVLHMFPYRFKRQMLEPGDPQQRLDFANEFCYDMMRITTGHFAYYGRTRRISP